MSAIITSRTATEVELLADGLVYQFDGTIVGRQRKIVVAPNLPLAINVRGPQGVGAALAGAARLLSMAGDFTGVVQFLSDQIGKDSRFREQPIAEVTVAGVVDGVPQVWQGFTHDYGEQAAGVFRAHADRYIGGAMGKPDVATWNSWGPTPDAPDGVLRKHALTIMAGLRALPGPVYGVEDGSDVRGVGGHIQYVRIGADGSITDEIIHEWPEDVVGEKVNGAGPFALAG